MAWCEPGANEGDNVYVHCRSENAIRQRKESGSRLPYQVVPWPGALPQSCVANHGPLWDAPLGHAPFIIHAAERRYDLGATGGITTHCVSCQAAGRRVGTIGRTDGIWVLYVLDGKAWRFRQGRVVGQSILIIITLEDGGIMKAKHKEGPWHLVAKGLVGTSRPIADSMSRYLMRSG